MNNPFGTVITAMVTPFDENLSVDYGAVKDLVDYLIAHGSDGIVVSGTTGESPTLDDEEKLGLFEAVLKASSGRAKVIAGTGSNNTTHTSDLTRKATSLGVDAIMLVTPFYNKPPQNGLYSHFKTVAEATDLPLLLYNVPGRTSCNLEADTVLRLSKVPNIRGLKEAGGDLAATSRVSRGSPDHFHIFSGEDAWNLPYLSIGASGFVSVASHVVGPQLVKLLQFYRDGKNDAARMVNESLLDIYAKLFITTSPIMVKCALDLLGVKVGGLRQPLLEATDTQRELMRVTLKELCLL